jgi:hypothetical protein
MRGQTIVIPEINAGCGIIRNPGVKGLMFEV